MIEIQEYYNSELFMGKDKCGNWHSGRLVCECTQDGPEFFIRTIGASEVPVAKNSICVYTEYEDSDGDKIFENDIITFLENSGSKKTGVVKWSECEFDFIVKYRSKPGKGVKTIDINKALQWESRLIGKEDDSPELLMFPSEKEQKRIFEGLIDLINDTQQQFGEEEILDEKPIEEYCVSNHILIDLLHSENAYNDDERDVKVIPYIFEMNLLDSEEITKYYFCVVAINEPLLGREYNYRAFKVYAEEKIQNAICYEDADGNRWGTQWDE